ncbi:conserved hypothetical protein [Hahella chejuensis KCTC 2396]|uniref:Uncharacterized protein n=1 Tax=Hahella chejuensis (strain KCTC 2396) TaxID=349521 RepID=Q2SPX7_HAHCH|nr:hypothetical protein [Hahella chejuensis]ABC27297.1 conserved hypothetical protein [Hahella chejuensis KCTC 2396]
MMAINYEQLRAAVRNQGHRFFETGDYNLNLVGVRAQDRHADTFNDLLCVAFQIQGQTHCFSFPATTDPGVYWREHLANPAGAAIVKPGQYPSVWALGKHQGKYEALVQRAPITVYRDANRDAYLQTGDKVETGLFGINCHRATDAGQSLRVDRWSAGCQVIADSADFDVLMALCRKAAGLYGNRFTYTLLDEGDL